MPSAVRRGPLTSRLILELEEEGLPVGDNDTPSDPYGWQGEPNAETSTFIPWMVITPLTGQPQRVPGALGDTGTEWSLPYSIFYSGLTRPHVEALADKMRLKLTNIEREVVTTSTGNWKIMKISSTSIGGVNRVGATMPEYFTQADTFDLWVSKE